MRRGTQQCLFFSFWASSRLRQPGSALFVVEEMCLGGCMRDASSRRARGCLFQCVIDQIVSRAVPCMGFEEWFGEGATVAIGASAGRHDARGCIEGALKEH